MSIYSLVNIPTLVRDLARHDRGGQVATDLLRAFALTDADLAELDQVRTSPAAASRRADVLGVLASSARALTVLAAARDVAESVGMPAWTAAVDVLDEAGIGGADDLVRFVRYDVLSAAWSTAGDVGVAQFPTALDVVSDGVLAEYATGAAPEPAVQLGRPWRRWLASRSPALPAVEGPAASVLAMVRSSSPDQLAAVGEALRRQRVGGWSWPQAVHDACWAVHLTGRERVAAVAQLHAMRSLLAVTGARPAPTVVAAVVAAVHASVVGDVLDIETHAAMTAPLLASRPV